MNIVSLTAIIAGAAVSSASAGLSQGTVSFTYANQTGGQSFTHTLDTSGSEPLSMITIDSTVSLTLDFGGIGGTVETIDDVRVTQTAMLSAPNEIGPSTFLADAYDASFEFVNTFGTPGTSDDEVILSGSYGESGTGGDTPTGALFILSESGTLTANDSFTGGELEYELGSSLLGLIGNAGLAQGDNADGAWTLTNIDPGIERSSEGFFTDFIADSAFTGSFNVVPSPGSMALASIAGVFLVRTRNRR